MADDEAATIATLKEYRTAIERVVEQRNGRVVNAPGDNLLAEFSSAVEAVEGAVEIQQAIRGRNVELSADRRMEFRVGVNLGDIIKDDDGSIYGDGVNIAARMEALADAGGICISSTVHDAVLGKLDFGFDFLGAQQVKNIDRPLNVYRVRTEPGNGKPVSVLPLRKHIIASAAATFGVAALGIGIWHYSGAQSPREIETANVSSLDLEIPSGPGIAVLPFENQSGDTDQDFFASGLASDISIQLSFERDLRVIGRASTAGFAGRAIDMRAIGKDLQVQYVLKGSVRRDQDTIRVTAELHDTDSVSQVWGQTFDRDLSASNLFEVQDEIAHQVVATISDEHGVIPRLVREQFSERPTIELSSYECVLLAHEYFEKITAPTHLRARECLESAVKRDPGYADAWGWLAIIYGNEVALGFNILPGSHDRSLQAAQMAIDVDQKNQMAWEGKAAAHYFRHEREQFIAAAENAIAINPNDVSTLANIGFYAGNWGMFEVGLPLLKKAIALSPYDVWWWYWPFWAEAILRDDYEAALKYAHIISPGNTVWTHANYIPIYVHEGRIEEAARELEIVLQFRPDFGEAFRDEWRFWNFPEELIQVLVDSFETAGLDIADEEQSTTQ